MIPVTKTYLPPLEEYQHYLEKIWESGWVTNNGKYSQELENKLSEFLNVNNIQLISSGTIALQIAIRVLKLKGEIITTPFSYVATTSSILWEQCKPVFVDVRPSSLTIDYSQIEKSITSNTSAILATHVFGVPCDVEEIQKIADKHQLKVIYDAAHAFGVKYKGRSLLSYGDISVVSFHATKLFHTIEGGGIVTADEEIAENIFLMKTFGHRGDSHKRLGINGKNSELHAAIGLCILPKIENFIEERKRISRRYIKQLRSLKLTYPQFPDDTEYNYGYFATIFKDYEQMNKVIEALNAQDIFPRRYFYPSLNNLKYINDAKRCPVSESVVKRILCLPLFEGLTTSEVDKIATIINETLPT